MAAARILRDLSVLESDTASEAEIEREIAAARRERASAALETDTKGSPDRKWIVDRTPPPQAARPFASRVDAHCSLPYVAAIPLGARTAAAQTPETIAGRVVNGTAGGTVPDRLEVVLLTLDESRAQIVGRVSTFVDEEGRFEFTGFSTGRG